MFQFKDAGMPVFISWFTPQGLIAEQFCEAVMPVRVIWKEINGFLISF